MSAPHGSVVRAGCGARGLIGFIFIGDLVKDIFDQKFIIEQLEHHIGGDWGLNAFGGEYKSRRLYAEEATNFYDVSVMMAISAWISNARCWCACRRLDSTASGDVACANMKPR